MKPHNYFWIGLFAIITWIIKIYIISLFYTEWYETLATIDFIYFIILSIIGYYSHDENEYWSEKLTSFSVFTNFYLIIFWILYELKNYIKLPKIKIGYKDKLNSFNFWIDKLFEKQNKQKNQIRICLR